MAIERRYGFVPNHAEFGHHIRSAVARRPAMQIARKIASLANDTAPVSKDDPIKPRESRKRRMAAPIKGSYIARPDGNLRIGEYTRAIAIVENRTPNAMAGEVTSSSKQRNPRTLFKAAVRVSITELGVFDGYGKAGRLGK